MFHLTPWGQLLQIIKTKRCVFNKFTPKYPYFFKMITANPPFTGWNSVVSCSDPFVKLSPFCKKYTSDLLSNLIVQSILKLFPFLAVFVKQMLPLCHLWGFMVFLLFICQNKNFYDQRLLPHTCQPSRFSLDSPVFYFAIPLSSRLNIFPYFSRIFNLSIKKKKKSHWAHTS